MPPRTSAADTRRALDRLAALRNDTDRRRDFAVDLLGAFTDPMVLHQALAALGDEPPRTAIAPLRDLLRSFAASPKKDPGGLLRAELLGRLDTFLVAEDLPLIQAAAVTVERTPNDPAGAAVLRAAALVALDRLDPDLAVAYATNALAKAADSSSTSAMTGEPAATAARVLAARDQWPVLLLFVQTERAVPAETVYEAIRGLASVPEAVLVPVLGELAGDLREVVLLGLADLASAHPGGPALLAWFEGYLRRVRSADVYRYALSVVVASRRHDLFEIATHGLAGERNRERLEAARDALALAVHEPSAAPLLREIEDRLAGRSP